MVPRDLHLTLQPQAPTFRASLQRALQDLFVDGSGTGYLKSVCDYVHLNPARARLLSAKQRLSDFRWSSYGGISQKAEKPEPLAAGGFGCWESTAYPRTVLPGESNSRKGWSCGGPLRMAK